AVAGVDAGTAGHGFGCACEARRIRTDPQLRQSADHPPWTNGPRGILRALHGGYSHVMNSATKAVVATLIALVRKDGLLDGFDHPLLDLFTDRSVADVDDRKKAITVQNLLDMTSGFDWEEGFQGGREQSLVDLGRSPDWVKFILDRPMAHAPGEVFYYNSGNSHLLSAIISKLTSKRAADY